MRHITILLPLLLVLTAACGEERSERGSGGEGEGVGEGEGPAEGEGEGPAEGEGEGPAEGEGEGAAALVLCDGTPDATPGADVCAVRPGDDRLVIVGDVLALDTVHEDGAVVLDADGRITCVGCECDTAGATQVICPEAVVSPGLINMHDHMGWMADPPFDPQAAEIDPKVRWEHRHDWRKGKRGNPKITTKGRSSRDDKHFGELRFVLGGATAINGSGSAPGLLRNLDDRNGNTTVDEIDQPAAAYDTFPLDDAGGSLHAWDCDYGSKYKEGQKDPPASNPYTFHISEGIDDEARNEFLCLVSESRVGIIHAVGVLAPDVYLMAQRGMKLIWSPRTNISLYGDTTPVTLFDTLGIPIGLGTDWMPSGSMNMLRELRCADDFNRVNLGGWFSDEDLWRMATVDGARSINMEDAIGALAIGLVGDIAVFANSGRRHYRAVIDANPGDVALVLRGGEVLAGNAAVVEALESGCDPIDDVCGSAKQVCLQREIGKTYAQLLSAVGDNYGLFHCDVPPNEPSCLPARVLAEDSVDGSSLYTGMSLEADPDGDGIEGDDDNCPTVFNPRRPLDGAFQADYDCDGEGDVCDSTPLGDDPTTPRPMDRDCDGVPDADDNCPVDANDQQEDGDGDDKGDACDPCPADANPGDQGCPTTIYDAKTNAAQMGRRVAMADMVVTAVNPEGGIFLQLDPDSADYVGPEHSGIWVYMGDAEKPAQWDVLAVHGAEVAEWYDQIELTGLDYEVVAQREPIPPHVLDADGVTQMVADQASSPWESLVVRVEGVEVTNAAPEAGPGDDGANEFEVTGGLRVDDGLFLIDPLPEAGEVFTFLVGPVPFKNGHMKLLPRADSDVGFGVAALASFGPETSFARVAAPVAVCIEPFHTVNLAGRGRSIGEVEAVDHMSRFEDHFPRVEVRGDGEWWSV